MQGYESVRQNVMLFDVCLQLLVFNLINGKKFLSTVLNSVHKS
jgi:hypothetical protein